MRPIWVFCRVWYGFISYPLPSPPPLHPYTVLKYKLNNYNNQDISLSRYTPRRHINGRASTDFTRIPLFSSDPCSGALNNTTGQFGSVDRDGNGYYEHDEHCLWNITVVNGTVIQLKFLSMDIVSTDGSLCEQDYIKVYYMCNMYMYIICISCARNSTYHVQRLLSKTQRTP